MKDYNLINRRATTCRHGGHCEWVACDKCNHYEPDSLNQQPCDDCISRQAVLDAINTYDKFGYTETGCFVREPEGDYVPYIHYDDVIKCIKNAPSVTPKEKTGWWIRWYETIEQEHCTIHDPHCKCSECNQEYDPYIASLFNFCPNCGAKMIKPQESEEV